MAEDTNEKGGILHEAPATSRAALHAAHALGRRRPVRDVHALLQRHAHRRAFVATDNGETQRRFERSLGHGRLSASLTPLDEEARRPTSVASAVVDLFTCVAAEVFKGTRWSSFSDAVSLLRRRDGKTHPLDEHCVDSFGIPQAERGRAVYLHDLMPPARRHLGVLFGN